MSKGFKISLDKALTIMAFVVSVGTLCLFFYQTSLMKKQQYASVLPYLAIGNTQIEGDYSFALYNNGIGPAFIDEINIHHSDSIYRNIDVNDFYAQVIIKKDTLLNSQKVTHATINKGMLIPQNQTIEMLRLSKNAVNFNQKHMKLRNWLNQQIKVEIIFSSIYGERWKLIYPSQDLPIKLN